MPALRSYLAVVAVAGLPALYGGELQAQNLTITGKVISEADSTALGGVVVQIKGTTTAVLTNTSGTFSFNVRSASDTLVFTRLGYDSQVVPVDGHTVVDVALAPAQVNLDRSLGVGPYIIRRPTPAPSPDCERIYAPMPGSAYDPEWQRNNPGVARAYAEGCSGAALRPQPAPRNDAGESGFEF